MRSEVPLGFTTFHTKRGFTKKLFTKFCRNRNYTFFGTPIFLLNISKTIRDRQISKVNINQQSHPYNICEGQDHRQDIC